MLSEDYRKVFSLFVPTSDHPVAKPLSMSRAGSRAVSVIIPCYNQARFLREAVESLLAQTHPDWECTIINDGSADDTERVALDLVRQDKRVHYLSHSHRGLAATRNRGLDEATGAFIQFLDADDVILPTKLESQLTALSCHAAPALAYCHYRFGRCDAVYISPDSPLPLPSRLHDDRPLQHLALQWEVDLSIPIHCYLFDAQLFRSSHLRFDRTLATHEDWDCWMRLLAGRRTMVYLDEPLAIYRLHESSMCHNRPAMRRGFLQAIKKQRDLFKNDPEMAALFSEKLRLTRHHYGDSSPLSWLSTIPSRYVFGAPVHLKALVARALRLVED